jgi:hypothetical protein
MQLDKRFLDRVIDSRARFEEHNDFLLVGDLSFPTVKRPRALQHRTARDQAPIEQRSNETHGFIAICDRGKKDNRVGVWHRGSWCVDSDWPKRATGRP